MAFNELQTSVITQFNVRYASLPPSSNRAGAPVIFSPSFHPLSFSLFDILKLLLSHMLNGIFCLFQSLCSFVVPLSHFAYFAPSLYHHSSAETWNSLGKCCSLFTIFTLLYFPLHLSLLLVSHLLFFTSSICPPLFVLFSSLSISLLSTPVLLFPLLLYIFQASNRCSIFRHVLSPQLIGC